jgi:hypothetical protein
VNHHLINGICAETDLPSGGKFSVHSILNCSNYNGYRFGVHSTKGLRVSMTTGGDLSNLLNTGQITESKVLYLFHWVLLFWGVLVSSFLLHYLFLFLLSSLSERRPLSLLQWRRVQARSASLFPWVGVAEIDRLWAQGVIQRVCSWAVFWLTQLEAAIKYSRCEWVAEIAVWVVGRERSSVNGVGEPLLHRGQNLCLFGGKEIGAAGGGKKERFLWGCLFGIFERRLVDLEDGRGD